MDGKTLTRMLAEVLNEDPDTSGFALEGSRTSYDALYGAAIEFNNRTKTLHDTQTITTVADQAGYVLDADHQQLFAKDRYNRWFVTYTNASSNSTQIFHRDEEDVIFDNLSTSVAVPGYFYVRDKPLTTKTRTGVASATGSAVAGQTTLTDATTPATFITWDVQPGDTIHNTFDGSTGYVLSVTSETELVCALFDGTGNFFTDTKAYTIVHQARLQLVFNEPTKTASETVSVPFVRRPDPVYSDYGSYPFQLQYQHGLVRGAAWILKYRDRDIVGGDSWAKAFERAVNQANMVLRGTFQKRGYSVHMKTAGRRRT